MYSRATTSAMALRCFPDDFSALPFAIVTGDIGLAFAIEFGLELKWAYPNCGTMTGEFNVQCHYNLFCDGKMLVWTFGKGPCAPRDF